MHNIIDRQTFVISVDLGSTSQVKIPMNLRFAADELILKSISYNAVSGADTAEVVQIWCSITNDNLIGSFPNNTAVFQQCDNYLRLNNTFQTGLMHLQFQETSNGAPFYYNPQQLIGANTTGTVSLTIEFIKHAPNP